MYCSFIKLGLLRESLSKTTQGENKQVSDCLTVEIMRWRLVRYFFRCKGNFFQADDIVEGSAARA